MVFAAIFMISAVVTAQTTISVQISDPHDDAEEAMDEDPEQDPGLWPAGYIELESGDLEMCSEAENYRQTVGLIFRDVQIPIGATVTEAYVSFTVDDTNDEDITVNIWGAAEANAAAPFTEDQFSITSHPKTSATVEWTPEVWDVVGVEKQTPNISNIINEIISIAGWAPGNNIMITVDDLDNPVKSHRQAVTYDENPAQSAILHITYVTGAQTISVQISDPHDDAEEAMDEDPEQDPGLWPAGNIELESGDLEMCTEAENYRQTVGLIFRNVQIPMGANVTSASVSFTVDDTNDEDITVNIWGAAEANAAAPFTEDPFSITSHPKTTATVEWTPEAWDVIGVEKQTPDISNILNEIIGTPGWAPGNNVMITIDDLDNPAKSHRQAVTYDENPEQSAKLNVTFTTEETGIQFVSGSSQFSIYPNPAQDVLYISNNTGGEFSYNIYSITGERVAQRHNLTGSMVEVNVSGLAKGLYLVKVLSRGITNTQKVIVK